MGFVEILTPDLRAVIIYIWCISLRLSTITKKVSRKLAYFLLDVIFLWDDLILT